MPSRPKNGRKKRRETTEKLEKLDETGDTSEFAENKPDELRLPEEVSAALRPERRMFKLEQQLQAVLQNFVLTADETLFESAVGRRYISVTLLPLLAKEKKQLWLDSSVIGTMFSKFRSSRPSDTEAFDEERRRALEKLHKSEKNAIKALRALNEHGLIRVVYSPTTSRNSSDNLRAALSRTDHALLAADHGQVHVRSRCRAALPQPRHVQADGRSRTAVIRCNLSDALQNERSKIYTGSCTCTGSHRAEGAAQHNRHRAQRRMAGRTLFRNSLTVQDR